MNKDSNKTLMNLKEQRESLRRALESEGMPQIINEWQHQELSAFLSVEYLYACGTLTDNGYSEQAMYGYIMALQHVREILANMTGTISTME